MKKTHYHCNLCLQDLATPGYPSLAPGLEIRNCWQNRLPVGTLVHKPGEREDLSDDLEYKELHLCLMCAAKIGEYVEKLEEEITREGES